MLYRHTAQTEHMGWFLTLWWLMMCLKWCARVCRFSIPKEEPHSGKSMLVVSRSDYSYFRPPKKISSCWTEILRLGTGKIVLLSMFDISWLEFVMWYISGYPILWGHGLKQTKVALKFVNRGRLIDSIYSMLISNTPLYGGKDIKD